MDVIIQLLREVLAQLPVAVWTLLPVSAKPKCRAGRVETLERASTSAVLTLTLQRSDCFDFRLHRLSSSESIVKKCR